MQIVTIHRSKGLEYPIVFCPFLWDGHAGGPPAKSGAREYHDDDGRPVLDFRDPGSLDKPTDEAIKARIERERRAEILRLTYVALTRAVYRCIVVVGPYTTHGRSTNESTAGPLAWLVAGGAAEPSAWLAREEGFEADAAALCQAFERLAAAHAPDIGIAPLPTGAVPPVRLPVPAPDDLAVRPPPRHIPPGWRIGSYSSLVHGARRDGAAVDHDLRADTQPVEDAVGAAPPGPGAEGRDGAMDDARGAGASAATGRAREAAGAAAKATAPTPAFAPEADDILHFPRGAAAGDCLHALFETADFTQPDGWPGAIERALQHHPQPDSAASPRQQQPAMLARLLRDVVQTPLPIGTSLARVPRARRLTELEFHLPSAGLSTDRLAALLRRHGVPLPALPPGWLAGYLRGFIDLVFEHDGRFHIVDWKSNHLGDTPAAYAAAPVARAMARHGYHLQALLYALALHRLLAHRLPDYDYERHVGQVMFLFVRGVRPQWSAPGGAAAGIHAQRPPLALIEDLSALFGQRAAAAAGEFA